MSQKIFDVKAARAMLGDMLNKEDYILVEVLGRDSLQVRALVAATANPDMAPAVHEMLRSLAR